MFKKLAVMALLLATAHNAFATPKWMRSLQVAVRAVLTTSAQKQTPKRVYVVSTTPSVNVKDIEKTTQAKIVANLYRQEPERLEGFKWAYTTARARLLRLQTARTAHINAINNSRTAAPAA